MNYYPKRVSSEVLHHNPWYDYKHDVYEFPDGKRGDYFYTETGGSGMAMVIPVLPNGNLLLTRQYRYLRERISIEFPGGGMRDPGQPAVETARMELLEETGYEAEDLIAIGSFDGSNGMTKDTSHIFLATDLTLKATPQAEPSTIVEILERRPDEFEDMIKRGDVWDGQTLAAWLLARERVLTLH